LDYIKACDQQFTLTNKKSLHITFNILPLQGFEVIYPIFEISMTLRRWLPNSFHHLVPNDNFHCQMPLKNAKFNIFGTEKCQMANLVVNTDWLTVTVLQAKKVKVKASHTRYRALGTELIPVYRQQ